MSLQLDHVQIAAPAGCEEAARGFYGAILGLTELARPDSLNGQGGCWFACGALQVHIGVDPDFRPARKGHAAFVTPDLDSLAESLTVNGYPVNYDSTIAGVRRFFSHDPWGNRLEFILLESTLRPGPKE